MANKLAYQVLMGAGTLYTGAFSLTGANEPVRTNVATALNATPQASAWSDAGYTNDGLTVTWNQEMAEMEVDQVADIIGRKMTKRDIQIKTNLAEATLENLVIALNSGSVTSGTGYKYHSPEFDGDELQPGYIAAIFDGYAPASSAGVVKRRRFIGRKVLSIDNVEMAYKKGDMTLIPVTFGLHYVSTTLAPYEVIDEV
jgi:hypothetical protein